MPTNQFGALAWLAPIAVVFWTGTSVFFSVFDLFALVWWQQALGFLVFCRVWDGLVERCARIHRVRWRSRALAGPRSDRPEGLEDATVEARAEPPGPSSRAPVQPRGPWSGLASVARLAFTIAFGLAIFYPSWVVKLLGFLALLVAALGLGSWERRQAMAAREGCTQAISVGSRSRSSSASAGRTRRPIEHAHEDMSERACPREHA